MDSSEQELTQFSIHEPTPGYWKVVFSNPPINLLNSTTVLELGEVVRRILAASELRVVVFTSDHPEFFMARYDLSDRNPIAFAPTESGVTYFIDAMERMNEADAITIASIRGRVRGGGSEFALSCDLRFASLENSTFGQPEVGVGIIPAGGAIERLAGLVGGARALEIIATADDFDARTAELYGWINRAVPDVELNDFVDQMARRLAGFDVQAIAAVKQLVHARAPVPPIDAFRETLDVLRGFASSTTTHDRRAAVVRYASEAGGDFELRMGHHLGLVGSLGGTAGTAESVDAND